jgi:hypothetical protein
MLAHLFACVAAPAAIGVEHVQSMIKVKSCLHDTAPRQILSAAFRSSRMSMLTSRSCRKQRSTREEPTPKGVAEPLGSPDEQTVATRSGRRITFVARTRAPSLNPGGFYQSSAGMFIRPDRVEAVMPMDAEEIQVER